METGQPQCANDGNIYFPTSDEEVKAADKRRTIVFSVREAIEALATVELSPSAFLAYALPHQLWMPHEEHLIAGATEWLTGLNEAWKERSGHSTEGEEAGR
jgi:hypothetical protein